MSKQNDYIGDDVPDDIKEIMQAHGGIHKGVLEVRNLKANTELCVQTLKNLKYQNLTNLGFLIFGSLFSFSLTYYFLNDNKDYEKKVDKLIVQNDSLKKAIKKSQEANAKLFDELQNRITLNKELKK